MRFALALVALFVGGDMGFPRGRITTVRDAVNRRLLTSGQESRYAPPTWILPHTVDAAAATFTTVYSSFVAPALLRLKGVVREETFRAAEIIASIGAAPQTVTVCVVLVEYEEDNEGVVFSEVARSITAAELTTTNNTVITAPFEPAVTLYPHKKYAVGVSLYTSGAGATLVGAPVTATASIRLKLFSFGTINTRVQLRWDGVDNSEVEWVERGAGAITDRPLVNLLGVNPTARWY